MLYRDSEILIFDEPTAVLTPQEIEELMGVMKNMTKEGKTIILITHKLKEIKAVADRCTVIRKGKSIATIDVKDASEEKMAELMVGRQVSFKVDKATANRKNMFRIEKLNVVGNRGVQAVKDLNLSAKAGEILGVAGVDGNGLKQNL